MTPFDDLTGAMGDDGLFGGRIDPDAIDALFGRRGEGDVPAQLSELDELVQAARQPGSEVELSGTAPVSAAVAAIVQESHTESAGAPGGDDTGRIRMVGKRRVAKVIGAGATSAALLAGGVAAAAVHHSTASGAHQGHDTALAHARSVERAEGAGPGVAARAQRPASLPNLAVVKQPAPPYAFGTVKSVDGSSAAGVCGTSGASGTFTVAAPKTGAITTVDVSPTTKFAEPGTTAASFASVCAGDTVGALGSASATAATTVDASVVYVQPPKPAVVHRPAAFGTVKSVDGSSASGSCGTSGASGTFTVANPKTGAVTTVDVTPTTKFADPQATGSATFANVCVGDTAGAGGTSSSTPPSPITASMVYVQPPKPSGVHPPFAFGMVKSVDGSSAAGTCGTSGASGTFTVSDPRTGTATTVDVTATTKFVAAGTPDASFATVCVGDPVAASGAAGTAALTASYVFVGGAKPQAKWPTSRPRSPEVSWFSGAPWGSRGRMTASPQGGATLASASPHQAASPSQAGSQPQSQWGSAGQRPQSQAPQSQAPQSQDPQGQDPRGQGGSQWGSSGGNGSGPQRGQGGDPQGGQGGQGGSQGGQGGWQH